MSGCTVLKFCSTVVSIGSDEVRLPCEHSLGQQVAGNSRRSERVVVVQTRRLRRLSQLVRETLPGWGSSVWSLDTQLGVVHTFTHFTVLCTFRTFPNAPIFVTETISSSVGIITDARHTLREPVLILDTVVRPEPSMNIQLSPTSSYWVQRLISSSFSLRGGCERDNCDL